MTFYREKDLAMCGLACVLCKERDCPGCKARGCAQGSGCGILRCVTEKGLDGCYRCTDFPCGEPMLQGARKLAFNRYARRFGKDALLHRLHVNHERGIVYHRDGNIYGDYDVPETEQEVLRLIHFGISDPYDRCPELETRRFMLRLVRPEDAGALLGCYADATAQALFHSENCTSDFCFETLEEMRACIDFWLQEYRQRVYIRFAIVDKARNLPVGTVEMFDRRTENGNAGGILRVDIASGYEEQGCLKELFTRCADDFFLLFHVEEIKTKGAPQAEKRLAVLRELGFIKQENGNLWCKSMSASQ